MSYDFIFIVNTLGMHGGTTFVNRLSSLFYKNEKRVLVLCLFSDVDKNQYEEISKYADIVFLKDYLFFSSLRKKTNQVDVFMPLNKKKLIELMHETHIHILGTFGLYFLFRFIRHLKGSTYSVGLYHQHEFSFSERKEFLLKTVSRIITKTKPEQFIFFNKNSCESFGSIWGINIENSIVTPIGINVPECKVRTRQKEHYRIVSVGNLFKFKTYNRAVISLIPSLAEKFPDITYTIIGDGPEKDILINLCEELGVQDKVFFLGKQPYERAMSIVEESDLFIGSGTVILEASVRYTPSIIGIESEEQLNTYGFIHQVSGYDYNEDSTEKQKFKIKECIVSIFSSDELWLSKSLLCRKKAEKFSIEVTCRDFLGVSLKSRNDYTLSEEPTIGIISNLLCFISFIKLSILDVLGIDTSFKNRRNG